MHNKLRKSAKKVVTNNGNTFLNFKFQSRRLTVYSPFLDLILSTSTSKIISTSYFLSLFSFFLELAFFAINSPYFNCILRALNGSRFHHIKMSQYVTYMPQKKQSHACHALLEYPLIKTIRINIYHF